MQYPTNTDYESAIRGASLSLLKLAGLDFIPSRTVPFKIFMHGSGSFAVIFKATDGHNDYAIRCFTNTSPEKLKRYKFISTYLKSRNLFWEVEFDFIENEININSNLYPLLKMNWVNGVLLNDYISANLNNSNQLHILQNRIAELSINLEENEIGHGDIQCLNILVVGNGEGISIKLVDYDGMYVPFLNGQLAVELGKPDFQHPNRNEHNFSSHMDRFSFWVILTGIEALKNNPNLWSNISHGGFNTSDNILFTPSDFKNPDQSLLFQRLNTIVSNPLNLLVKKLIIYCKNLNLENIEAPGLFFLQLYNSNNRIHLPIPIAPKNANSIVIFSDSNPVNVYSPLLQYLGLLPFEVKLPNVTDLVFVFNSNIIRISRNELEVANGDIFIDFKNNSNKIIPNAQVMDAKSFIINKNIEDDSLLEENNYNSELNISVYPSDSDIFISNIKLGKDSFPFKTKIGNKLFIRVEKLGYKTKVIEHTSIDKQSEIKIDLEKSILPILKVGYKINLLNGKNPEISVNGISHNTNSFSSEGIPNSTIKVIISCKGYKTIENSYRLSNNEAQNEVEIALDREYKFITNDVQ